MPNDITIYVGGGQGNLGAKVVGLLGQPLPSLNVGYIYWNGSVWSFQLGTPAVNPGNPPASWSVSDWYVNPTTGNDSNAGTSAGTAVKTVMGGIVAKWGTTSPVLTQDTTIHLLAGQSVGQENVVLSLVLVACNFVIVGTTTSSAGFSPASVTAKNRATPQLLRLTVANSDSGGQVIFDVTRGSYGFVDSATGAAITMTQPFAAAGLSAISPTPSVAEDNGWVNTDTYQTVTLPTLNLIALSASGGTQNGAFTKGTVWVQNVHIPDPSGTPGTSQFTPFVDGVTVVFSQCWIDPFFTLDGLLAVTRPWAMSCFLNGGATFTNQAAMVGGSASTNGAVFKTEAACDGDAIIHGTSDCQGLFGYVYFDGAISTGHLNEPFTIDPIGLATGAGGSAQIWGPGSLDAGEAAGSIIANRTGQTWVSVLTLASLTIDGATTAYSPPAVGTFVANGATQVDTAGVNGTNAFPLTAAITFALKTIGGTPVGLPYFSAAQTNNNFHTKAAAGDTSTYQWTAQSGTGVSVTAANLDIYTALFNPRTGSKYCLSE